MTNAFAYGLVVFLYSSIVFAIDQSPVIDPNKFTVCAITINSSDEKDVFSSQISKNPQKFNPVVELTSFGKKDWFQNACKSGIRCDQLIISGHFGGNFFGDSGKNLSLKELETAGCSKSCENILSKPYEVFLFGCNTLAGKDKDSRTPEQYLQVLLNDGIAPQQAEMIVQSRYGAIGDSNKGAMQRAFGGEPKQLYGFYSVGPSGKNVREMLKNYFSKHSPEKHLSDLQGKRVMAKVSVTNTLLSESLKNTAFTQCEAGENKDEDSKAICKLQDANVESKEKMALILELMQKDNYLIYINAINNFFKANPPKDFDPALKDDLRLLTDNPMIKRQVLGLISKTQTLGLKNELGEFAQSLGYMNEKELQMLITDTIIKDFEKPLTLTQKDTLCSMDFSFKSSIKLSDIRNKNFGTENDIEALRCIKPEDAPINQKILSIFVKSQDKKVLAAALFFLAISEGEISLTPEVKKKLKKIYHDNYGEESRDALGVYLNSKPTDEEFKNFLTK